MGAHGHGKSRLRSILSFAVVSRAVVLAVGATVGCLVAPYDASASLQAAAAAEEPDGGASGPFPANGGESAVMALLGPFSNWDGVFFTRVAEAGYEFENHHAFFPLLPFAIRSVVRKLWFLGMSKHVLGVLVGVCISNLCFVGSAGLLYQLGRAVLRNEKVAYTAAALYCINPASVFMSAVYTESPFALLSFAGMLAMTRLANRPREERSLLFCALAGVCFFLATLVRSNGIVLVGYIAYFGAFSWAVSRGVMSDSSELDELGRDSVARRVETSSKTASVLSWLLHWGTVSAAAALVLVAYWGVQMWGYYKYCGVAPGWLLESVSEGVLPRLPTYPYRSWCSSTVPSLYGFVQHTYWNIGFLNYYEAKQIPQFVLAAPMIILTARGVFSYFRKNTVERCGRLVERLIRGCQTCMPAQQAPMQRRVSLEAAYYVDNVLPFVLHWGALCAVAMLFMHIQVTTRFLASSPALYWYCSSRMSFGDLSARKFGRAVLSYFVGYGLVGSVLFCAFQNWT